MNHADTNRLPSYMTCSDGSSRFAVLNDDFCDCNDGSDEPETSACSMVLPMKRLFKCPGTNLELYPSRLDDGVRDCADGADERIKS